MDVLTRKTAVLAVLIILGVCYIPVSHMKGCLMLLNKVKKVLLMHLLLGSHSRPWVQAEQAFSQVCSHREERGVHSLRRQSRTSLKDVGAHPWAFTRFLWALSGNAHSDLSTVGTAGPGCVSQLSSGCCSHPLCPTEPSPESAPAALLCTPFSEESSHSPQWIHYAFLSNNNI